MNYNNPSRRKPFRLSTPVRLGVAAVAACFIAGPVLSNPVNPTVVNGTANFNQAANVLTVTNSNGAIINWDKFSIKAGETTHFAQTVASSSVLNRVLNDPSVIYGTLSSNGRVWLVNPAGIMVGPGGRVDTAAFVASTLNIRNEDFLAGRRLFVNDGSAKDVINQGEIKTPAGGSVYLIGSNVGNEGIITTPKGETILAAGATVSLIDSATPGVKVDITGAAGNATNLGEITAEAGRIGIAGVIVRNSGTLNASSVVEEGGRIFLKASQDAYVDKAGRIVTTGTKGGSVEVLGNRVAMMDDASIDASGAKGGGSVRVGGDYQGKHVLSGVEGNQNIQNANITYFGPKASLKADATEVGDGGKVIVWADDTTRAYGTISARGGAEGGNGGFVETSGKRYLDVTRAANVSAPVGLGGTWLLDPSGLTIINTGSDLNIPGSSPFLAGAGVSTLTATTINTGLTSGNVVITADGSDDISFDASVSGAITIAYGGGVGRMLTLTARDIIFGNGITTFQASGAGSSLGVAFNPGSGRKVNVNSSGTVVFNGTASGLVAAHIGTAGATWENEGVVTLSGVSYIDLDKSGFASTFNNLSTGTLNLGSSQGYAIQSIGSGRPINNSGLVNVTVGTAIEAAYSQTSTGQLTIGNGVILNLQNAIALSGNVNLNASGTLNINENHGTPADLTNLTFSGGGGDLNVDSAVGGPKTVNFTNVDAGNVDLYVGAGTVNVLNGYAVFKTLGMDGGTLGAITNGALGITSGNFTIPSGVNYTGNVGYFAAGNLTVDNSMTVPGALKLMAGWNGNIASPATISETGSVYIVGYSSGATTITAGTIVIDAGSAVEFVDDGGTAGLSSTAGLTSIRTGSGGLALPVGFSIQASGAIELAPSGNDVDMCIYVGTCAAEFSLDPSILSRVSPTGVLILGRPVADTSYTGKLTVLSDIPSSVVNGSRLALNGYDVEIGALANIGTTGVAFDKPLDVLANRNLTVTGNIVLGNTQDLVMNAGQSVNGVLDMNNGGALIYAGNITVNNPRGAITGITVMQTPPAGTLAVNAYGGISLTGGNFVGGFTASNTTSGGIDFFNTGDFNLGAVTNTAPGGPIMIGGGNSITQIGNLTTAGGAISVTAGNNLIMNPATKAQSYGGLIHYEASTGSVQLGLLDAGVGSVEVEAGMNITDANGASFNNIKAGSAELVASADDQGPGSIDVDTQVQSLLVNNDYVYDPSTITVRNSGSPLAVTVYSAPDTGQLTITNNNTINVGHIGGATNTTLTATGGTSDITVASGDTYGFSTLLATGNIILEAGRDILVTHDYVNAGGNVTATAGHDIRIASSGPGPFQPGESYIQAGSGIHLTMLTGGLYIDGTAGYAAHISTTTGDIKVVTSTGFHNSDVLGNGANGALDAQSGRWLIYAPDPATVVGAPAYNFKQYNTAYGGTILGAGDGVIYTLAPIINVGLVGTVNKLYDGKDLATLVAANFVAPTGMVDGDTVVVAGNPTSGTYDTKNVGTGKTVSASGLTMTATNTTAAAYGGSAQVYGYLFGGTASGVVGAITPASLSLSGLTAQNKVYDGTRAATLAGTFGGLITGDIVGFAPGAITFADRHVGTGKTVTISALGLVGKDAGNYTLAGGPVNITGNIAQRASVNWIGGTGTQWSTAANWAGGALPDRANVAAVTLGNGPVTYDYSSAPADTPILNSLNLAGGTLTVTGGMLTVPNWIQTAGDLRGLGGLTVSQSMSMNGTGTIDIGGPVSITHTGDLALGRIKTPGALSVTATGTLSGTNAAGTWVQTAGSILLDAFGIGAANDMLQTRTQELAINNRAGNAWIFNTGLVNVAGSSVGRFHLESKGGITTDSAAQVTAGGKLDLIAHSPIVVGAAGVQGGAGVLLRADTPDPSNSSILISGPVSSPGGAVVVSAYNDVTQNANITGNSVSVSSAAGSIRMAAAARTQATGGNISYNAPAGSMILATINAGSGSVTLDAGGSIASAPGVNGANITGGSAFINAGGSLDLSTNVTLLDVDVGGTFSVNNGGTVFSGKPAGDASLDQSAKDLTNATNKALTDKTPTQDQGPPPPDASRNEGSKQGNRGKTTGGTKDTFGSEGDETEDKEKKAKKSDQAQEEKKDDKPVAKKIAQCS